MRTLRNSVLISLLALFLCSFACYAGTADEAMLEQARQHFDSGNYYFATSRLARILKNYPATPHRKEILLLLARAYALSGRDEKAAQSLHELLKDFPETAATLDPELQKLVKMGSPAPPAATTASLPQQTSSGEQARIPAGAIASPEVPSMAAPHAVEPGRLPGVPAQVTAAAVPPPRLELVGKPDNTSPAPERVTPPKGQPPAQHILAPAPSPVKPALPEAPAAQLPMKEVGNGYYTLAAGETVNRKKLESLLRKLKTTGLESVIHEERSNREVYRLVSECYNDRKLAERRQSDVSRLSGNAFVIRNEDSYCVVASSLFSEDAAIREQERLAGKGLQVKVAKFQVPLGLWRVTVGRFDRLLEAERGAKALAARGIKTAVVKIGN